MCCELTASPSATRTWHTSRRRSELISIRTASTASMLTQVLPERRFGRCVTRQLPRQPDLAQLECNQTIVGCSSWVAVNGLTISFVFICSHRSASGDSAEEAEPGIAGLATLFTYFTSRPADSGPVSAQVWVSLCRVFTSSFEPNRRPSSSPNTYASFSPLSATGDPGY